MGVLCCPILSCPLYKRQTCKSSTEQVSIHRFPISNKKIRELWEAFVSEQNGAPFKSEKKYGLCTAHFGAKWIMPSGRICKDAIPSIAPVSTKKVLCKWNNSRLVPIGVIPNKEGESPETSRSPVKENIECVNGADNVSMAEDEEDDNLSSAGDINFSKDFDIDENSLNSASPSNSMNTVGSEVLDTVEKVEYAIKREKEEALKRYKASVEKVRSLKVLLNQLKEASSVPIVSSDSPPASPVKRVPSPSLMLKSPIQIPIPCPSYIASTAGDNGLPPPLFDDYN